MVGWVGLEQRLAQLVDELELPLGQGGKLLAPLLEAPIAPDSVGYLDLIARGNMDLADLAVLRSAQVLRLMQLALGAPT
jgi:hypothetical protein